jgi:ABC-type glutathione transport system ATPase component
MISRLHSETGRIEIAISAEAQTLRAAIEKQLKNVSQLHEKLEKELFQHNGLSWLPRNYFEDHISTQKSVENWEKGFEFDLPSIMEQKEFRRGTIIDDIKSKLDKHGCLLLAGESGSSKTTILKEIMTDYFVDGYEILHNLSGLEIKNGTQIVSFIDDSLVKDRLNQFEKEKKLLENLAKIPTLDMIYHSLQRMKLRHSSKKS